MNAPIIDRPVIVRNGKFLSSLSTDELVAFVGEQGYLVNNLLQLDNGVWRCNLRKELDNGALFFEFGEGTTLRKAIFVALHNAWYVENTSNQTAKHKILRTR